MSEKISEYTTSVTALASGDLMDVSKLISTSPDVYQSQKLNYSVLLTELNADLTINNLAKADLTSTAAARSFYLYGNTGSDSLRFRSLAGNPMLSLFGSGGVVIGNATTYGALQIYLSASDANGDTYYRNAGGNVQALGIGTAGQVLTVSGGGIPSWAAVSAPNLGSSNLTSTDDARTFTLKSGGTATQNLAFLNSGGGNLLKLSGDNSIDFGLAGTGVTKNHYGINGFGDIFYRFGGNKFMDFAYSSGLIRMYAPDGTNTFFMGASNTKMEMGSAGNDSYLYIQNSSLSKCTTTARSVGLQTIYLGNSGATLIDIFAATQGYLAVNGAATGNYNLEVFGSAFVKGSGATSATTTALFQNSSSVAALKVKDDGYCILRANNAAIASGDLANNEMSFYIDEGTNHCVVKVKYSSGTVKTGTFNLT
jgi:hypothetical protein